MTTHRKNGLYWLTGWGSGLLDMNFASKCAFLTLCTTAIYGEKEFDLIGGSGFFWSGWSETHTFLGDVYKAETVDPVFMREAYFGGLRLTTFEPKADSYMIAGLEVTGSIIRPVIEGSWKYTHNDSDGKAKYQSDQAATGISVPTVSALRGSGHIGLRIPVNDSMSFEFGILGGLGIGNAKYAVSYPDNPRNGTADFGGIGIHAALRTAFKVCTSTGAVLGLEYRLLGEAMGSIGGIFPGLYTSSSSVTTSAHLFLLSIGYRFGRPEKSSG